MTFYPTKLICDNCGATLEIGTMTNHWKLSTNYFLICSKRCGAEVRPENSGQEELLNNILRLVRH